ncbi:hypothetical protein R367_004559 [Salmonella enterica subsp. enterica serovar Braenderup]|nr:hypothetical protein [Salmonella enterica subsp. enterica serovar Braenderup]
MTDEKVMIEDEDSKSAISIMEMTVIEDADGQQKTAFIHPVTGEPVGWETYAKYIAFGLDDDFENVNHKIELLRARAFIGLIIKPDNAESE